ncbi:hypothetical protein AB837_00245 [bacterium AB1]|nr:hypothetical protein AB837_00245 [bacterium AB1]
MGQPFSKLKEDKEKSQTKDIKQDHKNVMSDFQDNNHAYSFFKKNLSKAKIFKDGAIGAYLVEQEKLPELLERDVNYIESLSFMELLQYLQIFKSTKADGIDYTSFKQASEAKNYPYIHHLYCKALEQLNKKQEVQVLKAPIHHIYQIHLIEHKYEKTIIYKYFSSIPLDVFRFNHAFILCNLWRIMHQIVLENLSHMYQLNDDNIFSIISCLLPRDVVDNKFYIWGCIPLQQSKNQMKL